MGGSCCKSSGDYTEIKFSKSATSRIKYNNNIKIHITSGSGIPINMNISPNMPFNEIKRKYCKLVNKKNFDKLVFVYKGKVIEETDSLNSMGIIYEINIVAFDGNDYNP